MVDQVEQKTPLTCPPQITEVDAAEGEVCFDGPAVPYEEGDEATASGTVASL